MTKMAVFQLNDEKTPSDDKVFKMGLGNNGR